MAQIIDGDGGILVCSLNWSCSALSDNGDNMGVGVC
jgi:hypothetical protein